MGQELLEREDVVLDPRHNAPHLVLVVEAERQALQVPEHRGAQPVQHPLADLGDHDQVDILRHPAREGHQRGGDDDDVEARAVAFDDAVDTDTDQPGDRHHRAGVQQHGQDRQQGLPLLRGHVTEEAGHDPVVVGLAEGLVVVAKPAHHPPAPAAHHAAHTPAVAVHHVRASGSGGQPARFVLLEQLHLVDLAIGAGKGDEPSVVAPLHDAPVFQH